MAKMAKNAQNGKHGKKWLKLFLQIFTWFPKKSDYDNTTAASANETLDNKVTPSHICEQR